MKNLLPSQKFISFALIIGIATLFFNCERNADEFGNDVLSNRDSIPVYTDTLLNYQTFLEREPKFTTNGANKLIMGNITNEYFGQTKSYALGQFFINTRVDSGKTIPSENINAEIIISPDEYYGTFNEMAFSLYEVNTDLDLSENHYSNADPEDYYSASESEISDSISFQGDSIIKIKLTPEFTQKLNKRSFQTVDDTLLFTEAIKGILFSLDNNAGGKGLLSTSIENCTMHLYYTEETDSTSVTDTINYGINKDFGIRFNMFDHDYAQATNTPNVQTALESEGEDSLLFIQNLQGTRAKVTFSNIDSLKKIYKDKLFANASLVFDVKDKYNQLTDTTMSNMEAYIYEEDSTYRKLNSYLQSIINYQLQSYEAYYDDKNNEMVFNLTAYIQSLVNNRTQNNTIYLHTPDRASGLRQIVLTGSNSSTPGRLEIKYYNTSE